MSSSDARTPIVPAVAEFLDFYEQELSSVRFPDVNSDEFAALVEQVHERLAAVDQARADLEAARTAFQTSQALLLERAEKGLAYARVYAEGNDELAFLLKGLLLSKAQDAVRKPAKRRRGKRAKQTPAEDASPANSPVAEMTAPVPLPRAGSPVEPVQLEANVA